MSTRSMLASKPPNLLIYHPDKDTTSEVFLRVKKSLELCLTPEHYVIYPLGLDDVLHHSPWKDNCKLLVVPAATGDAAHKSHDLPGRLSPRLVEEFVTYVQSGGSLLSLQPDLSQFLGLSSLPALNTVLSSQGEGLKGENVASSCEGDECTVVVCEEGRENYQFSCLVPNSCHSSYNSEDVYLETPLSDSILGHSDLSFFHLRHEWNKKSIKIISEQLIQSCDPSPDDVKIPCMQKIKFINRGCAVISGFDLLPILCTGMELELLLRLSGGMSQRRQLLTSLLRGFGLECSEERLPDLTHTFLLCSDKVRVPCSFIVQLFCLVS